MTASSPSSYWCELAVVGATVRESVLIEVDGGVIRAITCDVAAVPAGAPRLRGVTIAGLANAHSHAFHRALRSRTQRDRGSFWTWRELMYQAAARLDPDRYHRLARAVYAEMALAGISVVGEFHYLHHRPDGGRYDDPNAMGHALIAAASDAGVRLTMLDTLYLHGGPDTGGPDTGGPDTGGSDTGGPDTGGSDTGGYQPPSDVQRRFSDGTADAWIERVDALRSAVGWGAGGSGTTGVVSGGVRAGGAVGSSAGGSVPAGGGRGGAERAGDASRGSWRLGAAVHSVRAVDPESIGVAAAWATEHGLPLHVHVSEQTAENEACRAHHGRSPTGVLRDAGALGERSTAVHATHVDADDIAVLASARTSVCMCPTTERDLGDGIGPTARFAESGVELALGSDSHAIIDLFEEARAVELDERLRSGERGIHDARALLAMATTNGHRCLGWDDAGALAVGMRADLVTIVLDSVRTAGAGREHAVETAVFAATASDVTDVVIDGRPVVAEGRHLFIDAAAELDAAIGALLT